MRVVALNASPRIAGNTGFLLERLLEPLETAPGVSVERHVLNRLDYRGCQGCFACKSGHDACILGDDLAAVLAAAAASDVLVLASPVYFGDVTAQMKGFIDRTFSWLVPKYYKTDAKSRLSSGKTLVMLLVQGAVDDELHADIFPRYTRFFSWLGFTDAVEVRVAGVYWEGQGERRDDAVASARAAGARLRERAEREAGKD